MDRDASAAKILRYKYKKEVYCGNAVLSIFEESCVAGGWIYIAAPLALPPWPSY